uniref:Uncharacterized protein n=1 Tax=Lactuca sativa TaxID=4236 RepID=A0A9R1XFD8_LACSA|nr:hypothetical protein LSAT_V11C400210800 [Lactuca sativa]
MIAYESAMVSMYYDETSCHSLLNIETRCDDSRGVQKGTLHGFGYAFDPASFLDGTSSTITSQDGVYKHVRNEIHWEMDAKAAKMEANHQQMREEMDVKNNLMIVVFLF